MQLSLVEWKNYSNELLKNISESYMLAGIHHDLVCENMEIIFHDKPSYESSEQ